MKMGLKMAAHGWMYYVLALVMCLMFISGMAGDGVAIALNALLLVAIWGMFMCRKSPMMRW